MAAKGSCCQRCEPCEAEVRSCSGVCLECLPRRLCASVVGTFPEEYVGCCSGVFGFQMPMLCGTQPTWSGQGTCNDLSVSVQLTLIDNDIQGGCHVQIDLVIDGETDSTEVAFTSFPVSIEYTTALGLTYNITLSSEIGTPHPYNQIACNPCLCTRCLPSQVCVVITYTDGDASGEDICLPCIGRGSIEITGCGPEWSSSISCGSRDYTVTLTLLPVASGLCGITATLEGVEGVFESQFLFESYGTTTNGCFKCCRAGETVPSSLIGSCRQATCDDCTTDDGGCGTATMTELNIDEDYPIEAEGVDPELWDHVTLRITPLWCDSPCADEGQAGFCGCEILGIPTAGYEECLNTPTTITASVIAPPCSGGLDGATWQLELGTGFNCAAETPDGSWINTLPQIGETSEELYLSLNCVTPAGCSGALDPGDHCNLYRLSIIFGGDTCLGVATCVDYAPTVCSCDPLILEFEIELLQSIEPVPPATTLCDACPESIDAALTITIRITL